MPAVTQPRASKNADHSQRSATFESTSVARRAGCEQATTPTASKNAVTPANVIGSVGRTSYKRLPSRRVAASETPTPAAPTVAWLSLSEIFRSRSIPGLPLLGFSAGWELCPFRNPS
jgi:hypothetical protein